MFRILLVVMTLLSLANSQKQKCNHVPVARVKPASVQPSNAALPHVPKYSGAGMREVKSNVVDRKPQAYTRPAAVNREPMNRYRQPAPANAYLNKNIAADRKGYKTVTKITTPKAEQKPADIDVVSKMEEEAMDIPEQDVLSNSETKPFPKIVAKMEYEVKPEENQEEDHDDKKESEENQEKPKTLPKILSKLEKQDEPTKEEANITPYSDGLDGKLLEKSLKGTVTHFDDDQYQCWEWNFRAKQAMVKEGYSFAAVNYKLAGPKKIKSPHELKCGNDRENKEFQYLCAKCPKSGKEYIIIDWCDPNGREKCTVSQKGHIDVLVLKEHRNVKCAEGCEGYKNFVNEDEWELRECSFKINPKKFKKYDGKGDGSEYGKKFY